MGVSAPSTYHSDRSRAPRDNVIHLRLQIADEDSVRYVLNEWERDCGVKSNHQAQVNAIVDRNFRRTVDAVAKEQRGIADGAIRRPRHVRDARTRRPPLSMRGWPTELTAKPGKAGASAPVRHGVHFAPELWTLRHEGDGRSRAPERQRRHTTIETFRTLKRMNDDGRDIDVVVLWKLYGPTDPAADYVVFDRVAPIAHLTATARALGEKATKAHRREIAERFAAPLARAIASVQDSRLGLIDRALAAPGSPLAIAPGDLPLFQRQLEELERCEKLAGTNMAEWTAKRAAAERSSIEPREALRLALAKPSSSERSALIIAIKADCERMVRRSATAFYTARDEVRAA